MASAPRIWLSDNVKWIAITLVIPLTTWLFGQWQEHVAAIRAESEQQIELSRQAQEALIADARGDVAAMTALLPARSDPDPKKSALAVEILQRLHDAQHSDSRLDEVLAAIKAQIAVRKNSEDEGERVLAAHQQEAISQAAGAAPVVDKPIQLSLVAAPQVQAASVSKPNVVFLQIFSNGQMDAAKDAQRRLRESGVAVPGIENVSRILRGRALRQPAQVRFFNDADIGAAKWTAEQMHAWTGSDWAVNRTKTEAKVPQGQLELWWPTGQ